MPFSYLHGYGDMFTVTEATVLRHTAENPVYVVFPPAITAYAFEAAETLCEYIKYVSGIAPVRSCSTDVPKGSDAIILGDIPVEENREILAELNYGVCAAKALKHRYILATHTDRTLPFVVDSVVNNLTYEDGDLSLMCEFPDSKYTLPGYLGYVPFYEGGNLAACRDASRGSEQIVISGTNEDEFDAYLAKCLENGFISFCETAIEQNRFERLVQGSVSLYVYYTPFNKSVRIISEPLMNMHEDRDSDRNDCCRPLMTVIGARFSDTNRYLNCDAGSGNMGYVFRLEDGRFIVVDGGMELGDYAEKILACMREQKVGPGPITVACWFLSHTHIDHTGAFLKIADKYKKDLLIEEIAANFPSIRDAEAYREAWNTRRVSEAAYKAFPDAAYVRPHTGEIFCYGKTEIEILYTQDDLVKQYFSVLNEGFTWNTSSMCIRLKIGGNTVILPADCDEQANAIMTGMYGDYLKSDILQVCHHGGWGGSTEFYSKIDPELAIFSTSDELLPKYLQIKYNHDLVYGMNVKEVHNNADRCRTFELPYHPSETVIPPDPKEEILYTKAKQLEALAQIENLRKEQLK